MEVVSGNILEEYRAAIAEMPWSPERDAVLSNIKAGYYKERLLELADEYTYLDRINRERA
jgi:hypothetical protein